MSNLTTTLFIVIPVLLVSMSLHEMMHAITGYWLGDDTAKQQGRISLNPIKHIDPVLTVALPVGLALLGMPIFGAAKPVMIDTTRVRYEEFGAAIIGVVGPLTNLVLAIIAALLLKNIAPLQSGLGLDILGYFVIINIGFFVFNMLPIPPLDGSRLLYAFSPRPLQGVMDTLERFGIYGFFMLMLVLYPILLPILNSLNRTLTNGLIG